DTAGSNSRSRGRRANSACASSSAATNPGTATEPGPSSVRDGSTSVPAAPLPLIAVTSPPGERTSTRASPPSPQASGITTAREAAGHGREPTCAAGLLDPERNRVLAVGERLLDPTVLLGAAERDPCAAPADLSSEDPAGGALGAHEGRIGAGRGAPQAPGGVQ